LWVNISAGKRCPIGASAYHGCNPDFSPGPARETRAIATHFVVRTTPEFILPVDADLIAE
jgi:hypothetical protein